MREGDIINGLVKGLAVIECFDEDHASQSITDVANRTGLERATARRCLLTLTSQGYASYDGKFFRLTPRVLNLGHSYLAATPLPGLIENSMGAPGTGKTCLVHQAKPLAAATETMTPVTSNFFISAMCLRGQRAKWTAPGAIFHTTL